MNEKAILSTKDRLLLVRQHLSADITSGAAPVPVVFFQVTTAG